MRLEPKRRNLIVSRVQRVTPHSIRVTLSGDELSGFWSPSPDDHIKIFFPVADGSTANRDFTPLAAKAEAHTLDVEFLVRSEGVASAWAQQAKPGDRLEIAGPRGSMVVSAPGAWWLLVGDETAVPSVGRRLREMAAGTRVITLLAVTSSEEEQQFETVAAWTPRWIHRPESQAADPSLVLEAVRSLELPEGPGFIWIGTEGSIARAVRSHFLEAGHPVEWLSSKAYWSLHPEEDEH